MIFQPSFERLAILAPWLLGLATLVPLVMRWLVHDRWYRHHFLHWPGRWDAYRRERAKLALGLSDIPAVNDLDEKFTELEAAMQNWEPDNRDEVRSGQFYMRTYDTMDNLHLTLMTKCGPLTVNFANEADLLARIDQPEVLEEWINRCYGNSRSPT